MYIWQWFGYLRWTTAVAFLTSKIPILVDEDRLVQVEGLKPNILPSDVIHSVVAALNLKRRNNVATCTLPSTIMEDPAKEISSIVQQLVATDSPNVQKAALETYMTSDVAFRHPLCAVESEPNSRDSLLGIYQ